MSGPQFSIIVPTLNEAAVLESLLRSLRATGAELIVVDGGSDDGTVALAQTFADRLVLAGPGRAAQMNAGALAANGSWLWFVHADSELLAPVEDYLGVIAASSHWGFFSLRLSGRRRIFRMIENCINWRSRSTAVATGDQGLFIQQSLFQRLGGFAQLPLMEDIDMSKRLRALYRASASTAVLQTSSRRWERRGVLTTVLLMWRLRLLYVLGASPQWLARQYR
jgi:rSAM/selenodomain-associated transferase 2